MPTVFAEPESASENPGIRAAPDGCASPAARCRCCVLTALSLWAQSIELPDPCRPVLGRHEWYPPTATGWCTELHAALTPDGRTFLIAGKIGGGVRVVRWDLAAGRGRELLTIRAAVDVQPLALTTDGRTLAVTAAGTGTALTEQVEVQLWDVATGAKSYAGRPCRPGHGPGLQPRRQDAGQWRPRRRGAAVGSDCRPGAADAGWCRRRSGSALHS